MAISFTCPHCNEAYKNLKDELIGKRVTCKNPACRKIFVVTVQTPVGAVAGSAPFPPIASLPSKPLDAEALAAQAFADEPKKNEVVKQQKLPVTCEFCDHKFEVNADMEGRNTPCPECRKLVRVPLLKKETQVDWRRSDGGKDHLLKRDEPPPPEGVTKTTTVSLKSLVEAGAIPKIQYEPVPPGAKIKRALIVLLLLGGMGYGLMTLTKSRSTHKEDTTLVKSIEEIEKSDEGKNRLDLQSAIYRAAGEHRLRSARDRKELEDAVKYLNTAQSRAEKPGEAMIERQAELIEIAVIMCSLGGDGQELDKEIRLKWDDVQKHIRQTLQKINDPELRMQGIRRVTSKLAEKREGWRAVDIAKQIFPDSHPEAIGQIGLELIRSGHKDAAQDLLKKKAILMVIPADAANAPSLTALRIALGTVEQPAPLGTVPVIQPPKSGLNENYRQAYSEGYAFAGDMKKASDLALSPGQPIERIRALLNVGQKALDENAKEQAIPLLEMAGNLLLKESKNPNLSPWVKIRTISLLTRAGKMEAVNTLTESITDDGLRAWARMETLRARLMNAPKEAAPESWLDELGDPAKSRLGQAYARELFARHQALYGLNVSKNMESWPALLKPFGNLGSMLGSQDRGVGP